MNRNLRLKGGMICLFALLLILTAGSVQAQCAAAPIAASACAGGNGAATNGITINAGQTYWISGSTTLASITLSGGTLRICGTLTLTTLNFNSGNFIVESTGSATIGAITNNLNGNVVFINRGTINLTGSFTFQNPGNAIYNDLSTSVFNINGTVTDNNSLIVNRGQMSFGGLTDNIGAANNFCVQDQTITTIGALDNESTNSFAYSGSGSPACVNVTGSAILNHNLTTSSLIHVCQGTAVTPSGGAGWGSATVFTHCSSCATVLALELTGFTAIQQGNTIDLEWEAGQDIRGDEVFYVERSTDGKDFSTVGSLEARAGQDVYRFSDPGLPGADLYYRIRVVDPVGISSYTAIALIAAAPTGGQFRVYPNPVLPGNAITLVIASGKAGMARIALFDIAGRRLRNRRVTLASGNNSLVWDIQLPTQGVYIVHVYPPSGSDLFEKLSVRND